MLLNTRLQCALVQRVIQLQLHQKTLLVVATMPVEVRRSARRGARPSRPKVRSPIPFIISHLPSAALAHEAPSPLEAFHEIVSGAFAIPAQKQQEKANNETGES